MTVCLFVFTSPSYVKLDLRTLTPMDRFFIAVRSSAAPTVDQPNRLTGALPKNARWSWLVSGRKNVHASRRGRTGKPPRPGGGKRLGARNAGDWNDRARKNKLVYCVASYAVIVRGISARRYSTIKYRRYDGILTVPVMSVFSMVAEIATITESHGR